MNTLKTICFIFLSLLFFLSCKTSDSIGIKQIKTEKKISLSLSSKYNSADSLSLNIPISFEIINEGNSDLELLDWSINLDNKIKGWDTHRMLTKHGREFDLGNETINKRETNIYNLILSCSISTSEANNVLKIYGHGKIANLKDARDSIQLSSKKSFFKEFPIIFNSLNKVSDTLIILSSTSDRKGFQSLKRKINWEE